MLCVATADAQNLSLSFPTVGGHPDATGSVNCLAQAGLQLEYPAQLGATLLA